MRCGWMKRMSPPEGTGKFSFRAARTDNFIEPLRISSRGRLQQTVPTILCPEAGAPVAHEREARVVFEPQIGPAILTCMQPTMPGDLSPRLYHAALKL